MPAARTVRVLVKLLPLVLALRRDRKRWISQKKTVNQERFRKNARRALDTFVSLGPVYIKLGQWLSSRADILPQPYLEELAKLQDSVPPAPFEQVRPIIEGELGPIAERFESIDTESISGASLGQVYRGVASGRQLVIKVKRPGIEDAVREDLAVLKKVLPLALRFVDRNLRFSAKAMLSQFIETIREEMDYTNESENLKKIRQDMAGSGLVVVPSVYDEMSSQSVLTMEYLPGIKVTDVGALDEQGIDREQLVIDVHKVFFTMLLKHSTFHADPHPGNISVTPDGRLILYDYGMVGRINDETRSRLVRLYLALVEKNPPRVVNAMSDLGMLVPGYDRAVIEKGIELSIRAMHGNKPDEMEVQGLMELANRTMSRFPFVLPKNLALYMRMASIIEGIYKTHGVDFKFVKVLRDILQEEDLVSKAYVEELKLSLDSFARSVDAAIRMGPEVRQALDEARAYMGRKRPVALVSGSILAAALFVGGAILYQSDGGLGVGAMAASAVTMAAAAALRRH